jgi:hypothetical protein
MDTDTDRIYRGGQSVAHHRSIVQWIRHTLGLAHRRELVGDTKTKLDIIRAAALYDFPVRDIAGMLAEIEMGYATGSSRRGVS